MNYLKLVAPNLSSSYPPLEITLDIDLFVTEGVLGFAITFILLELFAFALVWTVVLVITCFTGVLVVWFFGAAALAGVVGRIWWTGGDDGVWDDIGVVWWRGGGCVEVAKGVWPRIDVAIILPWAGICPLMG